MGANRILLVEDDEDDYRLTRDILADSDQGDFELVWARTYDEAIREIRAGHFDAYLVDYRLDRRSGLDLLCGELKSGTLAPVFILTGQDMSFVDEEALRHGATGYLVKQSLKTDALAKSLLEAIAARTGGSAEKAGRPVPGQRTGRLVAFVGAKGGVGTSTVVANVAAALRARATSVLAVEMRSGPGSLAELLAAEPGPGLGSLRLVDPSQLDAPRLEAALASNRAGVRLLGAPSSPVDCGDIEAATAKAVCDAAVRVADVILVDLPGGASSANREVLAAADLVAVVTDRDPLSVSAARGLVSLLKMWQVSEPVGSIVVAKGNLPDASSAAEINAMLGLKKYAVVPSAPELFLKGIATRTPVVLAHASHPAGRALDELALFLTREKPGQKPARVEAVATDSPFAGQWG